MPTLYLYLHSHWDREWYLPFETFRTALLTVARRIVAALQTGEIPCFHLDGQSIALIDAIELAPDLKESIKSLVADRRLAIGPWYVLADQMLVSGESLVRNLKQGLLEAQKFGTPEMVGYNPDTFGHTQDLPRILSGFGIKSCIVWRGTPEFDGNLFFWWESPDGSRVLTHPLIRGYYQTILHEAHSIDELTRYFLPWIGIAPATDEQSLPYSTLIDGSLFPVGGDHTGPPANLLATVDKLKEAFRRSGSSVEIKPTLLSDFLDRISETIKVNSVCLKSVRGELRDNASAKQHASAYLLPGVLSSRLYLKRENRLAEHRLFAVAEPLHTLLSAWGILPYPAHELAHATKLLLLNHPHDSICGCSVDAVHDQMMMRSQQLHQVLDGLNWRARAALAWSPKDSPDPLERFRPLSELIPESSCGDDEAVTKDSTLSPLDPEGKWNRLVVFNLSGETASAPVRIEWSALSEQTADLLSSDDIQVVSHEIREEIFSGLGIAPYYKQIHHFDGWVWADSVPSLGFGEYIWPPAVNTFKKSPKVTISSKEVTNGLLWFRVESDGTILAGEGKTAGDGRSYRIGHVLRDLGDGGDTYNFDPIEFDVPLTASLRSIRKGQQGPLVGSVLLHYELKIPESLVSKDATGTGDAVPGFKRSTKLMNHKIITEITLKRGVPLLFFETVWQNHSTGHRLEIEFNTGRVVEHTHSENHFSLVRRNHPSPVAGLPVPKATEATPDRFPCQRFFVCNNQAFFNGGLPEYGVRDDSVSITLLRAINILSRPRLRSRGGGAGPQIAVPEAASMGENRTYYGWAPLPDSAVDGELTKAQTISAYRLAEAFEGRLWAVPTRRTASPFQHSFISLDSDAIRVTALYEETLNSERHIFLRLLNVTETIQRVHLSVRLCLRSVNLCSLDQRVIQKIPTTRTPPGSVASDSSVPHEQCELEFQPNQLLTVRVTSDS